MKYADIYKEAMEEYADDAEYYRDIREESDTDRRFLALDPWPSTDKQERRAQGRPMVVMDQLNQHVDGVVNDFAIHPRSVTVSPTGSGANDDEAALREDLIRQIVYESNGQDAHLTAIKCAVEGSYGCWALNTEYSDMHDDDPFDQKIVIRRISDPNSVYWDRRCQQADFSDMKHAFIETWMMESKFNALYKGADPVSFSPEIRAGNNFWFRPNELKLAEYWKVKEKKRKLVRVRNMSGQESNVYMDEYPKSHVENGFLILDQGSRADGVPSFQIVRSREDGRLLQKTVIVPDVKQYIMNGAEVIDDTDWPGSWIPIFPVVGKELWLNDNGANRRIWYSLIRGARDPQMGLNYTETLKVEAMSSIPKTRWVIAKGQMEGYENDWEEVHRSPKTALVYNPITDATGNAMLPPPRDVSFDPPIQNLQMAAAAYSALIQSAIGRYNPSVGRNDSGVRSAAQARILDQAADVGTFHFRVAYDRALRQEGRCINELITKFYSGAKNKPLARRSRGGETSVLTINGMKTDENDQPIFGRITSKKFSVTIDAGPDYQSQREKGEDFADTLVTQAPDLMQKVGDLIVDLKNLGPIGKEISERLRPPGIQTKDGKPIPPEIQQQLQQAGQLVDNLTQAVHKLTEERDSKMIEIESTEKLKMLELQLQKYKIELDNLTAQEKIKADSNLTLMEKNLEASIQQQSQVLDAKIQMILNSMGSAQPQAGANAPAPPPAADAVNNSAGDVGAQ